MNFGDYRPLPIALDCATAVPDEAHVLGVPWVAHEKAYCQSTSLQMVAEWRVQRHEPLGFYNWLMGFTYGAHHLQGSFLFLPYGDPEAGLRVAAPWLGLEHRYYVTDERDVFRTAVRRSLAQGRPLRVMVDSATLKGRSDYFSPHSIVVVGYSKEGLLFFETREADKREENAVGRQLSWDLLELALLRVSAMYRYPWTYHFTAFERTEVTPIDPAEVRARNARSLAGAASSPAPTGACAIRSLSAELERHAPDDPKDLRLFLDYGAYTRADNADFLSEEFAHSGAVREAAECLAAASRSYTSIVRAIDESSAEWVHAAVPELRKIAELESRAAELFER
jgi:hypothetical protein